MYRLRRIIVITMVAVLLFVSIFPLTPAYAFSIDNVLSPTANTVSNGGSQGQNIFNILLGLLLGNLLDRIFNTGTANGGGTMPPGTAPLSGKEVLGFYAEWFGTDDASFKSMMQHTDVINTIVPFWGTIGADGTLADRGGNDHTAVVTAAHQKGLAALLMVNNAKQSGQDVPVHDMLSQRQTRQNAIDNIEKYVKKYNLDGVNIDFESVPKWDKDNLTAFMAELYQRLRPQGYTVSIDVMPKNNENNDIAAAYDYGQLAKYSDKIILMTYDEHGAWSGAGAIASPSFVENSIKYALQFIPPTKLFMGVAGYGYDWSSKGVEALDYHAVQNLQQKFNATVVWDDQSQTPHFSYTGADGVQHQVWYENGDSTKAKLALVNKYNIAGIALWKLGDEDPRVWTEMKTTLKLK